MLKKTGLYIAILSLVISLTACNQNQINKSAQGITDTEVLIANCATTSGEFAISGIPFIAGIQAYLDKVNADGGIDGRIITFLHQDDEHDPNKGKACIEHMVETEKVFAIVGHFGRSVISTTLEDLKNYGIPSVYFAAGIGQLYNSNATGRDKGIMPVQPIFITEGQLMIARAVGYFKAQKIGIIHSDDDVGKDLFSGAKSMADELGVQLVDAQVISEATDVSTAVSIMKDANVDFIIGAAIQNTISTIISEMVTQSVNVDLITSYVNVSPLIVQSFMNDTKGKFNVYGNGWISFEGDRMHSLTEYAVALPEYADNAYALTGWIAAHFFIEGLRRLKGQEIITWDGYIEAMESDPIQNPFGGFVDFKAGKRIGTQEMNLLKVNPNEPTLWEIVDELRSIDDLLGR